MTRLFEFLSEYLRINAIRRMLAIVDVKKSEIAGLTALAVAFALFEGVGISLLLPILQYAEGGQTAVIESSGAFWSAISNVLGALGLPVTLPVLLVLAFIPILMRQGVYYLNAWYAAVVSGRIGVRMRMKTLRVMLDADMDYFVRYPIGRIVSVLVLQSAAAGVAIVSVMKQLTIALLIALYIAILFALSVPLTLVTLLFAVFVAFFTKASVRRIRDVGIDAARINQEISAKLVERFSVMRLIKLRDEKATEARRVEEFSESTRAISVKQARFAANVEIITDPLLMLSVFVTLYIGIEVFGLTLAQLGLILFVLNRLNGKVKEFNLGRQAISQNIPGLIIVREMTEDAVASNTVHSGEIPFDGLGHEISFNDVGFEYPDAYGMDHALVAHGKRVLENVSASIPAGSFTALVGRSGAGKSTLVELLPRLRDVTEGSITLDGVDVRKLELGQLRRGIGYLTQSAMLLNDTVRANLTYGLDHEPSEEQIRQALVDAHAEFVLELPEGLETMLGERGVRFSGGEGQRIALARVLLEDTSLLVLDEPTSALDSESEASIQEALAKLHGKKTIIVIAHRLATVMQADQLLVFEDGRIVERGTHSELMEGGTVYKRLFESQLIWSAPPQPADEANCGGL